MAESKIEWTDYTFNPWLGCVKVSPACDNCYAESWAKRSGLVKWGKGETRRVTSDAYWKQLRKWNALAKASGERKKVFCGSLCDVMEDGSMQDVRERLYVEIEACDWLDFLLLTKRPQNFRRFLPNAWLDHIHGPQKNAWLMTTVESAEYLWRVKELVNTPATVRGLSVEPLLGPISFRWAAWDDHGPSARRAKQLPDVYRDGKVLAGSVDELDGLRMLDWIIVGGESGPHARPIHPDWVIEVRNQCQKAGVAFLFKQWGEYVPMLGHCTGVPVAKDKFIFPDGEVVGKAGKHAAGRILDGRTWDEYPQVSV